MASQLECWLTVFREIPTSAPLKMLPGGMQENPNVIPLKSASSHGGSRPHLTHSSLGSPKSTFQMVSWSVQRFLHSSWSLQIDRQRNRPIYYVCSNRQYLASAAMQPNNLISLGRYTVIYDDLANTQLNMINFGTTQHYSQIKKIKQQKTNNPHHFYHTT